MARPKEIPGEVVRLCVTLPKTTRKRIETKARKENKTLAAVIRELLEAAA